MACNSTKRIHSIWISERVRLRRFKDLLKEVVNSFEDIPDIFKRNIPLSSDGNLTLMRNGNIRKKGNDYRIYTIKTFFLGDSKINSTDEKEAVKRLEELLLFKKLSEKTLTAKDIIGCRNAEIRRVLLEGFGFDRLVSDLKGIVINTDGEYSLIKINWHSEPIKLVRVKDSSTERWYLLRVPPSIKTVKSGLAWTFGFINEKDYNPIYET